MKAKTTWLKYYIGSFFKRLGKRLGIRSKKKRTYPGKIILTSESANVLIARLIRDGKPAMVARIGGCESMAAAQEAGISLGVKRHFSRDCMRHIHRNAGVFPPTEEIVRRFGSLQREILKNVDLLAVMNMPMQDYLVNTDCPDQVVLTNLRALEPFFRQNAWTRALKGKKVLVIHPFKETIESQYRNREHLFRDPEMLPEFDLRVVKAVQTIAGETDPRFRDWFEALDYMVDEALKEDFDVAIIGCGAYGMPLASRLKDAGKVAIHMGGATQLLFGIKGNRWDAYPDVPKLYNDYWVRPGESERPKNASQIEGACYW